MARLSKVPCAKVGCPNLVERPVRFCPDHLREAAAADRERRADSLALYDRRWAAYSKAFLRAHPLCVTCAAAGLVVAAEVTDHVVPHQGSRRLFWDRGNHQALCKRCHDRKTVLEDGGFGRGKKY